MKRKKPRLTNDVRERLSHGSAHKNKKAYKRKEKHSSADEHSSADFFYANECGMFDSFWQEMGSARNGSYVSQKCSQRWLETCPVISGEKFHSSSFIDTGVGVGLLLYWTMFESHVFKTFGFGRHLPSS